MNCHVERPLYGKIPDSKPFVRCAKNLAHLLVYEDTPLQCTQGNGHEGPHTYDSKHPGRH
jgi:hypothetical protein